MKIEDFKGKYPIGTEVRYYPVMGLKHHKDTCITSDPWELGHGDIVVKIVGVAGGVSIDHIKPAL